MASVLLLLWFPMMVCLHACTAAVVVYVYSAHREHVKCVCMSVCLHCDIIAYSHIVMGCLSYQVGPS